MYTAFLAVALLVGCLLAVQASMNLQLNKAVGTPYGASTIQLALATGLLALLALVVGSLGALGRLPEATGWHLLGGLASPFYITCSILLFPRLGAVASVGLFVTGQMFASLGLDLFGLLGVEREALDAGMVLGSVAVLAGIVVIIWAQRRAAVPAPDTAEPGFRPSRVGWITLGVLAGAVLPVQGAVNAGLREDLGEPLAVALVSFTVATLTIAVVLFVLRATNRTPRPRFAPLRGMPWWGWLGAACATGYVTGTFLAIPVIGAAATVALTVTGQQLTSAAVDHYGLLRMPRRPMNTPRITGLLLLLAGSLAIQLL